MPGCLTAIRCFVSGTSTGRQPRPPTAGRRIPNHIAVVELRQHSLARRTEVAVPLGEEGHWEGDAGVHGS